MPLDSISLRNLFHTIYISILDNNCSVTFCITGKEIFTMGNSMQKTPRIFVIFAQSRIVIVRIVDEWTEVTRRAV